MKRILVTLLTVVLAGSLLFMGTAAAQDGIDLDTGIDDFEAEQDAEAEQNVTSDQDADNTGEIDQGQTLVNANSLEGTTGDAPLVQFNNVNQDNDGVQEAALAQAIEQESEAEQEVSPEQETEEVAGTPVDVEIDADVSLPPGLIS